MDDRVAETTPPGGGGTLVMRRAGWLLVWVLELGAGGCTAPRPAPDVGHPEASVKILGIKQAAARMDRSVLPQLVESLDSDDPAVRFFAIGALERFAGERFGYEYYFDEQRRKPFVGKWQKWLKGQPAEPTPRVK